MNAFAAGHGNWKADELFGEIRQLADQQNTSGDGAIFLPATYLRGTAIVRRPPIRA